MRQQLCNSFFRTGIVADTPIGMIDRLLEIDQQKNRAVR
jgi:hypothetical protein